MTANMTTQRIENFLNSIAGKEACTKLQDMLNELIPDNTYIYLVGETYGCTIPVIAGDPTNHRLVHAPSFRKHNGHFYVAGVFDKCNTEVKPEDIVLYTPYNYIGFWNIIQDYNEGHFVMLDDRDK